MKPSSPTLLSLHQLSLYNTGRMSPEQVIAAFAARRPVLDRILADIQAEKPKSRAQHHLIVGQRGMGKTMLLARIAAELRQNEELKKRFIPLVFAEEQYAVDRLSKFWLNCLDSLADARELTNDAEAVKEIDDTVDRFSSAKVLSVKEDQPLADAVYAAFVKAAQATGQRPVLLVDNLQIVFERLETEQQHSLRELLMRQGAPILIGASPSPPPESQDYGAAFYDHFKVHYLRPLEEEEMRDLMLHLAKAADREDVRQRVLQHPARLKILRQLTGGNPRTTLTLFFLYAEDFAPSVFGDLEGLLDRVTPLYKARFEELTAQQQVITSAIANHWDPVTATALVQLTALPASTLSAQLDRLEKTGTLEKVELFGETRTGYMIAERFFNIWFLMRSASRRQRREVEFLTRFLENFYEPQERVKIARYLMDEDQLSPDRYLWRCAVAESLPDKGTAEDLKRHTDLMALRQKADEARSRLHELIDFDSLPPATLAFNELRQKLMSLVPAKGVSISPEDFAKTVLGDRAMFMSGERKRLASRSDKLSEQEIQAILATIAASRKADVERYSEDAVAWFSGRLATGQIRDSKDADDWNRAFKQVNVKLIIQLMVDTLSFKLGINLSEDVFLHISSMLCPAKSSSGREWTMWGHTLQIKLGRFLEAESAYREAISYEPHSIMPWYGLGFLLHTQLKRPLDAEKAYREAIACDPQQYGPWYGLGELLHTQLNRPLDAENAYLEAIKCNPNKSGPRCSLGSLLQNYSNRYLEAESVYLGAIEYCRGDTGPWIGLGNLFCDFLNRLTDADDAYNEALKLDPENESAQQNRLFLRRDFLGEGLDARRLLDELVIPDTNYPDTNHLHEALFAAYDSNWGLACESIGKALVIRANGMKPNNTDDWLRASAVLIHLNYGTELLNFLDQRGDTTARLRPWVEAVRAVQIGDKRALQNIAPEIRTTAEIFYDGIERRLFKLPEKTRRRPLPKVKAKGKGKANATPEIARKRTGRK